MITQLTIQLTLTLARTNAQVVEMSVSVNNSPIQDYAHLDDHAPPFHHKVIVNLI